MRLFPVAGFRPVPPDLFEVLHVLPEVEMCQALGVSQWQLRGWLDGTEPVPLIVYRFAKIIAGQELPAGFGEFVGVRHEGGMLYAPNRAGKQAGITYNELSSIQMIRELINSSEALRTQYMRAMKERDFYKGQCFRDTRYGMVVNELFNH